MESGKIGETIATYEADGRMYEIDHLGAGDEENYAEFAVYQGDDELVAMFITDHRKPLPAEGELIALAKSAVSAS